MDTMDWNTDHALIASLQCVIYIHTEHPKRLSPRQNHLPP